MRYILGILFSFSIVANVNAEPLGRLFSSPEQRDALNYMRKAQKELIDEVPTSSPAILPKLPKSAIKKQRKPLPKSIAVQGFVKRSDGKSTIWVNGNAMQEGDSRGGVAVGRLKPDDSVRVPIKIKANGQRLGLRVGQAYESEHRRVREFSSIAK